MKSAEINTYLFYSLALGEILLGILMFGIGIIFILYTGNFSSILTSENIQSYSLLLYYICIGGSLWCGVWAIIAGSIGIHANNATYSVFKINLHMGFATVAAVSSTLLCWISVPLIIISIPSIFFLLFFTTLVVTSLTAFSSFVVSVVNCITITSTNAIPKLHTEIYSYKEDISTYSKSKYLPISI